MAGCQYPSFIVLLAQKVGGTTVPAFEMTALTSITSPTVAAMGPMLMTAGAASREPCCELRPLVGFSAATPHRAAGTRTDPPPSTPTAMPILAQKDGANQCSPTGEKYGALTQSKGADASRNNGSTPRGSAPCGSVRIVRVSSGPGSRVEARHAYAQLVHGAFAHQHGTYPPQRSHTGGVLCDGSALRKLQDENHCCQAFCPKWFS